MVCFDETPRQLIGEARVPVRAEPGRRARADDEYVRNGTANVFMFDEHDPEAERIRVVLDNLSTHAQAALHERFAPAEARRILSRIELHFTPKHASWLNMVEIEIGVMVGQCLDRRISDQATLVSEIAHWERRRNRDRATIDWTFTVERAREKLGRAYPAHKGHPHRRTRQVAA